MTMHDHLPESKAGLHHEILMAGFGGQGVLTMGQILAEAAVLEGLQVVSTPAYGPEMRGGPSFCSVIISSKPIGAPVVTRADMAIILDQPSMNKYQQSLCPGGVLLFNSSLVHPTVIRDDIRCFGVRANHLAEELGEARTMNMIMLGALLHVVPFMRPESILRALGDSLPAHRRHLLKINEQALQIGAQAAMACEISAGA